MSEILALHPRVSSTPDFIKKKKTIRSISKFQEMIHHRKGLFVLDYQSVINLKTMHL